MSQSLIRLSFVACLSCLVVACQKTENGPAVSEIPPARGDTYATSADAGGAAEAGDGAPDGDALEATDGDSADGDVADIADVDVAADMALDVPEVPDVQIDIPVEKPTGLADGEACQDNSWCRSKFCVDGVCCNTACEGTDPMRCNGCSMAKTGQKDGVCAADRSRERMNCGLACEQVVMDVSAVVQMICVAGKCQVPVVPSIIEACRKEFDPCTTSFCNQPTDRTASCVNMLCPQKNNCCCETSGNTAQRSCVNMNSCTGVRACVWQ